MNQDVHCPFRLHVPEGTSNFTVLVPREFSQERQFHFADLSLAPDYYNLKSAKENMDTDEELDAVTQHELYLLAQLDVENMFPNKYEQKTTTVKPVNLVKEVNDFFENTRPNGMKHSGFFFDWIDIAQKDSGMSIDEYVQTLAVSFYNEEYNPEKHYNALPPSVRSLSYDINNNLYPTTRDIETLKRIRWRMWVGTNTKAFISSDQQLQTMGFSDLQIGKRITKRKQFLFEGLKQDYSLLEAQNESKLTFTMFRCIIGLVPMFENYVSPLVTFTTTVRDEMNNKNIETKVKNALIELVKVSNFDIDVLYEEATKKFNFSFPNNQYFQLTLNITVELAHRLGYGLVTQITKNSINQPRPDDVNVKEAGEQSRTLAFDTGLVIVEVDNIASNTTFGVYNTYMASLYPNESGILTLSSACYPPPTTRIPFFITGSSLVPVQFRLSRFIQDNVLVPLVWKTGAFVNGVLRGTKL